MREIFNTKQEIEEYLKEYYQDQEIILFDNYDYATAFIGITNDNRAIYSYELMLEYLIAKCDMDLYDAIEWLDYNTIRVLEYTSISNKPLILYDISL